MPVALPLSARMQPRVLRPPPVWVTLCFVLALLSLGIAVNRPIVPDELAVLEPIAGL